MADIIDFNDKINQFFQDNRPEDGFDLEALLEATPTGELISDIFIFMEVIKEYADELESRGFEVVVIHGDFDDCLGDATVGIRQVA